MGALYIVGALNGATPSCRRYPNARTVSAAWGCSGSISCPLSPTHLSATALCCLKKVAFRQSFFPIKTFRKLVIRLPVQLEGLYSNSLSAIFLGLHFLDALNTKQ
jgi:hypothetical protein